MSNITIQDLYDLNETIAAELFDGLTYPWEALPKIGEFIKKLGAALDPEEYDKVGEDVWIAKSANVFPKRLYTWTGHHRKRSRGASLCIYPR